MSKKATVGVAVVSLAVLGLGGGVFAHHGVTGQYDGAVPIVLHGTVTAATFSPPHPVLAVEVTGRTLPDFEVGRAEEYFGPVVIRPEDVGQVLQVEFAPARMFYELSGQLRPGDEVTVLALRNCLPPHQLRSSWLRLSDGKVLSYTGDWAPSVDGCP